MTQTRFDVLTIGNAIVDIIAPVEAGFIEREGMKEGIMHLIDTDRAEDLYGKMPLGRQQISGGSGDTRASRVTALAAWARVHGLAVLLLDGQIAIQAGEDIEALIVQIIEKH